MLIWVLGVGLLIAAFIYFRRSAKIDLDGRIIVITGAASGFGLEITNLLISKKCKIFALDINKSSLDNHFQSHSNVTTIVCDVTKQSDIDNAFDMISKELGSSKIYGLVNNAGISNGPTTCVDISFEDLYKVVDVNLFGMHRMIKTFFPLMSRRGGGYNDTEPENKNVVPSVIINITSVAGLLAGPFMLAYNISKWGGEALTDTLRKELSPFGIQVTAIEPFFARTSIIDAVGRKPKNHENSLWKEHIDFRMNNFDIPLMTAEYVAGIIVNDVLGVKKCPTRVLVAKQPIKFALWMLKYVLPDYVTDWITWDLPERKRKRAQGAKKKDD